MKTLKLAFTPDPDDAFAFYALVHGLIPTDDWKVDVSTAPIDSLNRLASAEALDIAAISSVHYPQIAGAYSILRSGASVGRGYGPVLVGRDDHRLRDLAASPVAIPGETTTAAGLLRLFLPWLETTVIHSERIRQAVADGRVTAGVLIHEELLNYPDLQLKQLVCLGEHWSQLTDLPLPVALNVVHRRLGRELARDISRAIRDSVRYALAHRGEASAWARNFGRGPESSVGERFIHMFANDDTVSMPGDVVEGLAELFRRLHAAGLAPALHAFELLGPEGEERVSTRPEGSVASAGGAR